MSFFHYKVKDDQGRALIGVIEAYDQDMAADILNDQGFVIIKIIRRERVRIIDNFISRIFNTVKKRDVVFLLQQLSILISADITIVQAFRIVEKQTQHKYLKKVILDVADKIEGGNKISKSFSKYPEIFSNFFVKMIESGETSGKLEDTFLFLASQEEKKYLLRRKIRNAMIYPIFILSTLFLVGVVMLSFVVPNIATIFVEAGVPWPFSIKVLMAINSIIFSFWWIFFIFIGAILYMLYMYNKTYGGKVFFDSLMLKIPAVGLLLRKFYLVQFSRSFYTLVSGGVDISRSFKLSKESVDNIVYQELIEKAAREVEDGNSIASVFLKSNLIPPMYGHMINVGEESGKLSAVLEKLINFYTNDIEDSIKNAITLFEPVVMIIIGVAVGLLIATVIIPVYNLSLAF
jgi:type II secretory pathway component PulF